MPPLSKVTRQLVFLVLVFLASWAVALSALYKLGSSGQQAATEAVEFHLPILRSAGQIERDILVLQDALQHFLNFEGRGEAVDEARSARQAFVATSGSLAPIIEQNIRQIREAQDRFRRPFSQAATDNLIAAWEAFSEANRLFIAGSESSPQAVDAALRGLNIRALQIERLHTTPEQQLLVASLKTQDDVATYLIVAFVVLLVVGGTISWGVISSVAQSIRRQKETFDKLRESERELKETQRLSHVGSWEWNVADSTVTWTEESYRIWGVEPEEFEPTFENITAAIPPDEAKLIAKVTQHAVETGESYEVEHRVIRPDGSIRHVLERGEVSVWDEKGKPARVRGSMLDITEQRDAEEKLRGSEARYRELFDDSPVAIWEEDWSRIKQMLEDIAREGVKDWREYFNSHREQLITAYDLAKIGEVSRAALTIFGAECIEDLDEINAGANVSEEELDAFRQVILSFLAGQMLVENQSADRTINESEIIVRRRVAIPPKYRHDWSRVIYAIEDVTESKQIEEQLRQAQKMEAVGQLTGGVAHEFNNLLMVILGNIETLEFELEKDDPLQVYTAAAKKGTLRGAELTQSLLAFSRKQRLEVRQVDLGRLVLGMTNLLRRTLGETITIKTELAESIWPTSVDAGQVEATLLNFALNARDAMPNGGTITVRTSNLTISADQTATDEDFEPGDYVALEVADTGTGMTDNEIEHAFEPFYSTKDVGKGTGLGLSVAYGFAKQSGGRLEIESEPGRGTTVRLILPRADEAEPRAESGPEAPAESASGSGRILVLEDDAEVRQLVCGQLRNLGYEVFEAADGPAALLILDEHPDIDLLFCDMVLPGGLSGPQTVDKAQVGHPDLKVLFTSGYPEKNVENLRVGDRDIAVLSKPYRKAELAEAVAAALNPS